VIKTHLVSNEEIQTNKYGFHTIVVKIKIRSKLKLICSLSFWSHGVPNATVVGFNHMMPGVLVTNKFDTAFEDRPCQNFPHAIEVHFFY
jgi:hypothetical protein